MSLAALKKQNSLDSTGCSKGVDPKKKSYVDERLWKLCG